MFPFIENVSSASVAFKNAVLPQRMFAKLVALELSLGPLSTIARFVCSLAFNADATPADVKQISTASKIQCDNHSTVHLLDDKAFQAETVDIVSFFMSGAKGGVMSPHRVLWYCCSEPSSLVISAFSALVGSAWDAGANKDSILVFLSLNPPDEQIHIPGSQFHQLIATDMSKIGNVTIPFGQLLSGDTKTNIQWLLDNICFEKPSESSEKRKEPAGGFTASEPAFKKPAIPRKPQPQQSSSSVVSPAVPIRQTTPGKIS